MAAPLPPRPPDATLRADAERNRDRIMEAARRLYATEGLGISMASVAMEAGVGRATLARRFRSKAELVAAVFAEHMNDYLTATEAALADPDPWQGFSDYITAVCAMQANDRGFADVLTISFPEAPELETLRGQALASFLKLISNAKATGNLRPDFQSEDLFIVLLANAGVVSATGQVTSRGSSRLAGLMLRAFAAPGAPLPELPPAPTSDDLNRAMVRA